MQCAQEKHPYTSKQCLSCWRVLVRMLLLELHYTGAQGQTLNLQGMRPQTSQSVIQIKHAGLICYIIK